MLLLQNKYTATAKISGNYYKTGVEANHSNEQRIADDKTLRSKTGQAGENKTDLETVKPASAAEATASNFNW